MASNKTVRAAIYARQSIAADEGIERQIEACKQLSAARDYTVVAEFRDNAVSGYKPRDEGTAFDRMLESARAKQFDVLVVRKVDRLGRSLTALEQLTSLRVHIVTVDGDLDLTTPNGRLVANLVTAVARNEIEVKSERRVNANAARRQKGIPTAGREPYGYAWVPVADRKPDAPTMVPDDKRADVVRLIFDRFLAGASLGSIAREVNGAGHRTKPSKPKADGSPGRVPEGALFRPTTVRRILQSPYYAGRLPIPPEGGWPDGYDLDAVRLENTVPGNWEALVSVDAWQIACDRLRHPERKTSPGPSRRWLLSGLAVCAVCGKPIIAGGGERGVHSYRCASMKHFMRRGAPLDDFIERVMIARLSRSDAADLIAPIDEGPDRGELRSKLDVVDGRIREVGDDYDAGLIERPEYARRLGVLRDRARELRAALAAAPRDDAALAEIIAASDVEAAWRSYPLDTRRAVISRLLEVRVRSVGQGNYRIRTDEAMAKTVELVWKGKP